MTFKEQLIEKANLVDIQKDIEYIKQDMLKHFSKRKYKIFLYDARTPMAIAANSGSEAQASFFIPCNIKPEDYRALFVKSLKDLGFIDTDIALSTYNNVDYDSYNIVVTW